MSFVGIDRTVLSGATLKRWSDDQPPLTWDEVLALLLAQLKRGPVYRPAPISATRFRVLVRRRYRQLLATALGWRPPP